ncbi:hypothetical protein PV10_01984 [Exophiala mesophila]|uniref:Uncharacterized protein n=1 Tax=Exophiala mesophila TaxID=212818 RepID=A0A0D1WXP3_EXOME|nr:uncharacterized protein PV10_01984 [Exophiala mesophila]KIV94195.1 hypothetical protein PV10_01984 [Exophiala mesophila]
MAYRQRDRLATAAVCLVLCLLTTLVRPATALQTVPGSPCQSTCARAGNLQDNVVCLDADYGESETGRLYRECVSCQLNSTAIDTGKNETDVEFALIALRYTLAGCMFAIPRPYISISSPCQVSCQPLNDSIGYQITEDDSHLEPTDDFCRAGIFPSKVIDSCAFCYSLIPQQLFLANFLQALHIVCVQPPTPGKPFFPDGRAIFNETLIAGPPPPSEHKPSSGGLRGGSLALAIALPIVGGILIIGSTCWCCYIFTRKRRRQMARTGRMSRIHDAQAEQTSPSAANFKNIEATWSQSQPPTEMHAIYPISVHGKPDSPGVSQGRWSHQTPPSEQATPVRHSFQRDDVGPGKNQIQDPNLHELYFGIDEDSDDKPSVNQTNGQYYDQQARMQNPSLTLGEEQGHMTRDDLAATSR